MVALNTLNNCKQPGWTWQKRDGTGKGRIDYLMIDQRAQNQVWQNNGAMDLPTWATQGSAIDHRPVQAIIKVKTLQEKGMQAESIRQQEMGDYCANNRILTKAYEAHKKMRIMGSGLNKKNRRN